MLVLASLTTRETLSSRVATRSEKVGEEAVLSSPRLVTAWARAAASSSHQKSPPLFIFIFLED